jgi:beta-alanine--pyruvate transaminase
MVKNRMYFGTLLAGVDHLPHTLDLERNRFSRGQPEHGAELADALERLVALHDASTIAAVIVEPVAGSIGVYPPPVGYLQRLREITERHGILLIFDEVITAYGRLGTGSAAEYFGVLPDLVTTAKGLTSGTVPMGAVMARKHVHDAVVHGPGAGGEKAIELFHGYTYSAHPLACAAALATLETYKEERLFERARELAPHWEERLHSLRGKPNVVDVRNIGLMGAIDLSPRPGKPGERAYDSMLLGCDKGVMLRITGDTIAMSPPLVVTKEQIDEIVGIVGGVLEELG